MILMVFSHIDFKPIFICLINDYFTKICNYFINQSEREYKWYMNECNVSHVMVVWSCDIAFT